MMNALLAHSFAPKVNFSDIPWQVIPYTFLGLVAAVLIFFAINKLLTPFFGGTIIETYEEDEYDE